jgi:formate hydrogenlyase subunit 6/NADH:ubiquinone oxidoreductase subunit I
MAMVTEVLKHLFKKRATLMYPFRDRDKIPIPEGLRGKISFNRELCIGCGLCARFCPSGAAELIEDDKGKRPIFHIDRCLFCAQCEEVCPRKAITLTREFEVAGFNRSDLIVK